jgi:nucleoside-diphosphate-sugar epimerase
MLGIALIKQCVLNSVKVNAIVKPGSLKLNRLPKSNLITLFECDINNLPDLDIKGKVDLFYHIAWSNVDKDGRNSCEKQFCNIKYTLDAINLAQKIGCKKFIGTGSQAEYGRVSIPLNGSVPVNPETAYGIAKYTAGKFCQIECERLQIKYNWIRVLSVYGSNDKDGTLIQTFMDSCRNNKPMALSSCTHIWDYLYEEDAGRALFAIGLKGIDDKTYCLGSGVGKPLKEYLEIMKDIINPDYIPQYGTVPYSKDSVTYLCADISELSADTGWRPEVSFEEGIRMMITPINVAS